jgi:hypothetical protein
VLATFARLGDGRRRDDDWLHWGHQHPSHRPPKLAYQQGSVLEDLVRCLNTSIDRSRVCGGQG